MEGGHSPENARGAETCASKVRGGEGSGGWEDGALAPPALPPMTSSAQRHGAVPRGRESGWLYLSQSLGSA